METLIREDERGGAQPIAGTGAERRLAELIRSTMRGEPIPFRVRFASGYAVDLGTGPPGFQLEICDRRGSGPSSLSTSCRSARRTWAAT